MRRALPCWAGLRLCGSVRRLLRLMLWPRLRRKLLHLLRLDRRRRADDAAPRVGDFLSGNPNLPGTAPALGENDFSPAPRVSFGYVNCNGLGFRTTFWQFDQNLAAETQTYRSEGVVHTSGNLNVYAIDNEVTQRISFCLWEMTLGAGIRYGAIDHQFAYTEATDPTSSFSNSFYGIGPTVSIEARRPLGCTNFALIGKARCSLLLGEQYASVMEDEAAKVDSCVAVGEIQLGAEWSKPLCCGRFFVQGLWEAQVWSGSNIGSSSTSLNNDLGLIGGTLAIGLAR